MTRHRAFKRLVRSRMAKTGESYTAARATLLAAGRPKATEAPALATSEAEIRRRTGRGWEEWFDLLDEWGADARSHREIARRIAAELDVEPLAWNAQAVAISYERARGGRAVGERPSGFAITAQKTVAVAAERLFDAFVDEATRARWLTDGELRERTATKPRSARFDWGAGETRVNVTFEAKGEAKSMVALEHERLGDAEQAAEMKAWWRERLSALKSQLEEGDLDA